jgi:catechol 2,3-dioxygenase-like lactoylglutathione lyase family enzyme
MNRAVASPVLAALVTLGSSRSAAGDADAISQPPPTLLRALAFNELLGFASIDEMDGPRDPLHSPFPLAAPSHRFRLRILESSSHGGGRIGLLAFSDPAPPVTRAARGRVGRGDMVFVFEVADAEALQATLVSAGARVVERPQTFRSRRTDAAGHPWQGKVFHAFDPDGNLFELLQPARPPDRVARRAQELAESLRARSRASSASFRRPCARRLSAITRQAEACVARSSEAASALRPMTSACA